VLSCGHYGKQEMMQPLEIKSLLVQQGSSTICVHGLTSGLFCRQRLKKRRWHREAASVEKLQVKLSREQMDGHRRSESLAGYDDFC
jgi:hypothetical protein